MRTILLLKNREILIKKINRKFTHFKYGDSLYVVKDEAINNFTVKGRVKGAEIIFFEGDPEPLSAVIPIEDKDTEPGAGPDKRRMTYLNELVIANALKQLGGAGRKAIIGSLTDKLGFFASPKNWILILFIGAIIYAVVFGGGIT